MVLTGGKPEGNACIPHSSSFRLAIPQFGSSSSEQIALDELPCVSELLLQLVQAVETRFFDDRITSLSQAYTISV